MKSHIVIPAQPGWSAACPVYSGVGGEVESILWEPVIAWIIEAEAQDPGFDDWETYTTPVTVDPDMRGLQILMRPNGTITEPATREFSSERALIDDYNELAKRKREKEAAKTP